MSNPTSVVLPQISPEELVERVLVTKESMGFEVKRVGNNTKKIDTIVAFANTEGGILVLGVEDSAKANGRDRLYGIEENPESVDELKRLLPHRITPVVGAPHCAPPQFIPIACKLRDGKPGSIIIVVVEKSSSVHSIVDDGTLVRMDKSNRQLSASEITELSMRRGVQSFVNTTAEVPFELLDTAIWREYRSQRHLTRPIDQALPHLGLAKNDLHGVLRPTRAAVLLFAEEPSGVLDSKCAIRIFHYKGDQIEHKAETNLVRTPKTISGPLTVQIRNAKDAVIDALASGVQMGAFGFEIVQKYPVRVINEAITNAVIHRDYRLSTDIHIRIFDNRIEVDSPGAFPGRVTAANIGIIGSQPRNRALVDHLREFPTPPNLDAGEGVRMMQQTMDQATLYPPIYLSQPELHREAVVLYLFNQARPSVWDQVKAYLDKHGEIGNTEVRAILHTDDPTKVSRLLRDWVERGLLTPVPTAATGKRYRRYQLPGVTAPQSLFAAVTGK